MSWGWRLRHLPASLLATGAVLAGAAVVGGLTRGGAGAAGAAAGVTVAGASFLVSTLVIAWADRVHSSLVLPFGLAAYAVKLGVIGLGMAAVAGTDWPGLVPMSVGVVAGVIAWTASQIWWIVRHPPSPAVSDPAASDPAGSDPEASDPAGYDPAPVED